MTNNIAVTYWNILEELSLDSGNTTILEVLNSVGNLSHSQVQNLLEDPRISAIFMVEPVFAINPALREEFIRNFPYSRLRSFNQQVDQKLILNQLQNYYFDFIKNINSFTSTGEESTAIDQRQISLQSNLNSPEQNLSDSEQIVSNNLPEGNNLDSQTLSPNSNDLLEDSSLDPNQNIESNSKIDQNTEYDDQVSFNSKTKITFGEFEQNKKPFVENQNQESSNEFNLGNPNQYEKSKPDDSIADNKQNLAQKQQQRKQKLIRRGVPVNQGSSLFGGPNKQAPKMSLLKKGVLAGAFSTVAAGSGLTLFQILFT